jgi:hypothetical protein
MPSEIDIATRCSIGISSAVFLVAALQNGVGRI